MPPDIPKPQALLGRHLTYRGVACRVIEILEEGPALVLEGHGDSRIIQANQYGEACRRAPRTFTVPLLNVRGDGLNPALLELANNL